jgi:hypothetical protein
MDEAILPHAVIFFENHLHFEKSCGFFKVSDSSPPSHPTNFTLPKKLKINTAGRVGGI